MLICTTTFKVTVASLTPHIVTGFKNLGKGGSLALLADHFAVCLCLMRFTSVVCADLLLLHFSK